MPPFGNFKLKVISNEFVAPNILLLKTISDQSITFLGGQYFSFKVAERINRAYSTASAPGEKTLDFVVDITPQGPGSVFVQNLKEGNTFDVMGPFGFFNLVKAGVLNDESQLLFVATGTGIAPIRSMIIELLKNRKEKRKTKLYFGIRYEDQEYYFDEMEKLGQEFDNFSFIPVVSRPSEKWIGKKGYCQDVILKNNEDKNSKVFVCGRTETVKSISSSLIENGFPKENVFFEKFG